MSFIEMIERSQTGDKETVVASFKNTEEFPEICSKECPHTQCSSWGTDEMMGKPCRNRIKTNEQLLRTTTHEEFMQKFQRDLEKALQPLSDAAKRIEKLEQRFLDSPDYHSPAYSTNIEPFNGEGERLPTRLDIGMNQSRIIMTENNQND